MFERIHVKLLYTIVEAAELLGVGRTTIYEYIKSGKIRIVRIGKRGIRISVEELDRFIVDNAESP